MKIPRITIEFDRLICETEKAYQFTINGKDIWIPKSLSSTKPIFAVPPNSSENPTLLNGSNDADMLFKRRK